MFIVRKWQSNQDGLKCSKRTPQTRPYQQDSELLVATLLMSAMFAISLLPFIAIGDGRKARAIASYRSAAMLALHVERGCRRLVIVSRASMIVSIGVNCHRGHQGHRHCKTDNQFLHFSIHCFVSCATSN